MSDVRPEISYLPPQGDPLGVNPWFRFGAAVLKPILNLIIKKENVQLKILVKLIIIIINLIITILLIIS